MDEKSKSYSRWTNEDKVKLLQGLKVYGHNDYHTIAKKLLPSKSVSAVRSMIYKYVCAAKNELRNENPLDDWLQSDALRDDSSMVPEALLYISLFEDHPPLSETGGIDIAAFYELFHRAASGSSLPGLSPIDIDALSDLHTVVISNISSSTETEVLEFLNSKSSDSDLSINKTYSKKK